MSIRTYSEMITIPTFMGRYEYLRLGGKVGDETFGFDRWLNQMFYRDPEWKSVRNHVIVRDNGCDLGLIGHEIPDGVKIMVHHMNPITKEDIMRRTKYLLDPEYLISTIDNTHKAIHYGDSNLLVVEPIVRSRYDTCPWKR